ARRAADASMDKAVPRAAILGRLDQRYGPSEPIMELSSAPAQRFGLRDGTTFGIIPSTTAPFWAACDRSRLTGDGMWYLCLYSKDGLDLRGPLRAGSPAERIKALIRSVWQGRQDRGA